jgi:hypothetical protein
MLKAGVPVVILSMFPLMYPVTGTFVPPTNPVKLETCEIVDPVISMFVGFVICPWNCTEFPIYPRKTAEELTFGLWQGKLNVRLLFPYASLILKKELKIDKLWTPTLSLLENVNPGWKRYKNLLPEPVGKK